ncbi:MAG: hypothetical protein JXD18_01665, partial [Anaerolineae bacterium]|nr:hypothetical protein [Anaerolineae bacterium]
TLQGLRPCTPPGKPAVSPDPFRKWVPVNGATRASLYRRFSFIGGEHQIMGSTSKIDRLDVGRVSNPPVAAALET